MISEIQDCFLTLQKVKESIVEWQEISCRMTRNLVLNDKKSSVEWPGGGYQINVQDSGNSNNSRRGLKMNE